MQEVFCRTWKLSRGELMAWRSGLASPPSDVVCSPRRFGEDARNGPECALPALWRHILGSDARNGQRGPSEAISERSGFHCFGSPGMPSFPFHLLQPSWPASLWGGWPPNERGPLPPTANCIKGSARSASCPRAGSICDRFPGVCVLGLTGVALRLCPALWPPEADLPGFWR